MLPTAWCRSWSKFVVVNKIPSVQIAHSIMVSCSVADDLQTVLIARNIVGVMESRSGIGSLLNTWALATPTVVLAVLAWRRGQVMACPSRFDST